MPHAPRRDRRDATENLTAAPASVLIDQYLGQREALARFLRARMGPSGDVEDLLQDIYLRVAAAGDGADIQNPRAYLYRLASNLLLDRVRSRRQTIARDDAWRQTHHLAGPVEDVADTPSAEDILAGRQRLSALLQALETLPPKTRQVFRMHKFEGLSYAETAERMGISRSGVEKHMMDALRVLARTVKP
jgi:RNA polymerase sigma factor (sigma-70 family)